MKKIKKEILFLSFLFIATKSIQGQNLVPNPSFEDTIPCASYQGPPQMICSNWFWAQDGSSDFFNLQSNCIYTATAPANVFGFQNARSGTSYAGFYTYVAPFILGSNGREYIESILLDTMKAGHQYCISFYVVAADGCKYLTDAIGAYLSADSIYEPLISTALVSYSPQVSNPTGSVLNDTLNRMLISGIYTAGGGGGILLPLVIFMITVTQILTH